METERVNAYGSETEMNGKLAPLVHSKPSRGRESAERISVERRERSHCGP